MPCRFDLGDFCRSVIMGLGRRGGVAAAAFLTLGCEQTMAQDSAMPDAARLVVTRRPEFHLLLPNGGVSVARFGSDSVLLDDGRRLAAGMVLNFSYRKFMNRSPSPNRIVTLWTGERFPTSWDFQPGQIGMATLYGDFIAQPMFTGRRFSPVASIRQPVGTLDTCPTDVRLLPERSWHVPQNVRIAAPPAADTTTCKYWEVRRLRVVPPLKNGLVLLAGHWPTSRGLQSVSGGQSDLPNGGRLRFVFQDAAGNLRKIEVLGFGAKRHVTLPDGGVRKLDTALSRIQVRIEMRHGMTLSCGGRLAGKFPESPGKLVLIEAEGPFVPLQQAERDSWRGMEVREPLVRRLDDSIRNSAGRLPALLDSIRHPADHDRVVLTSGDELYGKVSEVARAVSILPEGDKSQVLRISRDQVSAVCFARQVRSRRRDVSGIFSLIDLVPDDSCSIGGIEERFWIRTAITGHTREELFTHHPALGMLNARWPMIRRITPLFEGTYLLLDPGPKHLGNAYRESFSQIKPDGTKLECDFKLENQQVERPVFLSADIAEMIPSAQGTLTVTPFLDEVRAGFLATQVFLNEGLAGTLNELISVRSSVADPERVRLRLPVGLLKAGKNKIEIRQSSARADSTSFDDCELRAVAIEIEHPVDPGE